MLRMTTRAWGQWCGLAAWVALCGSLAGCKTGTGKVGEVIDADPPTLPGDAAGPSTDNDAGAPLGGPVMPGTTPPTAPASARKIPTQGSAVAITADDKWAVAANRTAGRISVFKLDFAGQTRATKTAEVNVGKTSEPWSVVIGNDDNTAFVVLRKEQKVVRIRNLRSMPVVDGEVGVTGAEPTGLAISPTGARLYTSNWSDGTVSVIDSGTLKPLKTIDLNPALASSGMLGANVAPRAALAHPRAIVLTNDGDSEDGDERIYVTEFFAQSRTDFVPNDDSSIDLGRQGVVYSVEISSGKVDTIAIAPVTDTGFRDSKGQRTGCFPSQLYAATINSGRLYVTAVCESPRGPVGPDPVPVAPGTTTSNFKTQVHAGIFVIDLASNKELPAQGVLLPREFDRLFTSLNFGDDGSRRMPLIPNDIMFAAKTTFAYVSGYGSDAVYRIAYRPDGSLERVGAASQPFIDLKPGGMVTPGELPVGIASANAGASVTSFALAINESSRNLSVLSFGTQTTVESIAATDPPAGADVARNRGRKFFVTGLGRWSLNGQAWNSCESCHPDGLTDNTTWYFARGPRQTTSLDASYDPQDSSVRRVFNWTGIFDEVHDFELNTRGNSGGVGALVHRTGPPVQVADRIVFDGTAPVATQVSTPTPQKGLNGTASGLMGGIGPAPRSVLADWDEIDKYIQSVRTPRAPTNLATNDVAEGKRLFDNNGCAGCHGTTQWTLARLFYTPSEENNRAGGLLQTTLYRVPPQFPGSLNPPASRGPAPLRLAGVNPANDQINCVLRDVGTFPVGGTAAVAPSGVNVREVRQDMTTLAQGASGFNIPSLLGMASGAPYFHAGAARTLEEAHGATFDRHRRAFAENFQPDAAQVRQRAAYVLSIDEETPPP
ncbi:MAG TPA: hypothetical protein VGG33_26665, partial [Polyangia bacterium]